MLTEVAAAYQTDPACQSVTTIALKVNAEEHLSWVPTGEGKEVTTMTLTMDTPKQMIRNDEDVLPAVPENHVNNMLGKMVGP